jgi:hypothetical protein
MQRVKCNRENSPDPVVIKQLEEHEIDCEVGENEKAEEWFGVHQPVDSQPEMSAELIGITDHITRIEEWHVSYA